MSDQRIFEVNGKFYKTDAETLGLLTELHNEKKDNAAQMVFNAAIMTGRIAEIKGKAMNTKNLQVENIGEYTYHVSRQYSNMTVRELADALPELPVFSTPSGTWAIRGDEVYSEYEQVPVNDSQPFLLMAWDVEKSDWFVVDVIFSFDRHDRIEALEQRVEQAKRLISGEEEMPDSLPAIALMMDSPEVVLANAEPELATLKSWPTVYRNPNLPY